MLTQDTLKYYFDYDYETGLFVWVTNPAYKKNYIGKIAGFKNKDGYIRIKVEGELYMAHRLAFLYMTGEWPTDEVDHINRIRNDNRWCNLRQCNRKENNSNSKKNIFVEYGGEQITLAEACRRYNINYVSTWRKINKYGYSPEEAIQHSKDITCQE